MAWSEVSESESGGGGELDGRVRAESDHILMSRWRV